MSDEDHLDFFNKVYEQMLPEFTVASKIFIKPETNFVAHEFQIFINGALPFFDKKIEEKKGCWNECIIKN